MSDYYEFAVTGRGDFPTDMLRFDQARPKTVHDVRMTGAAAQGKREVVLLSATAPTRLRWESFGWSVTYVSSRDGVLLLPPEPVSYDVPITAAEVW